MLKAICLVGPSASGKTSICEALSDSPIFQKVRTATTRTKRNNEKDNAYYFLSKEEFNTLLMNNKFLETSEYAGQFYGTPISSIENIVSQGKIALVPIDLNGALKYKEHFGLDVLLVYIHRNKKDLIKAIVERDIPSDEKAQRIMQLDDEITHIDFCDACIINNKTIDLAISALNYFAK